MGYIQTCIDLARNSLVVLGAEDGDGDIFFDYCCDRPPGGFPRVKYKGNVETFINDFFKLRMELLAQGNGGRNVDLGVKTVLNIRNLIWV